LQRLSGGRKAVMKKDFLRKKGDGPDTIGKREKKKALSRGRVRKIDYEFC